MDIAWYDYKQIYINETLHVVNTWGMDIRLCPGKKTKKDRLLELETNTLKNQFNFIARRSTYYQSYTSNNNII